MTEFENLLKKIEAEKGLRRQKFEAGATYICESYVSDKCIFGWVVTHPAKNFPLKASGICAMYGKKGDEKPEIFDMTPAELLQLRETLAMHADFYTE